MVIINEKIDSWIEVSKQKLERSFDYIESRLHSYQFLMGSEISINLVAKMN